MQPINHIFLFQPNIDLRNEQINEKTLCMLEQALLHKLSFDRFGRAQIDKTEKISQRKENESATSQREVQMSSMSSMSSNENGKDTIQDMESTSEKDNKANHHTSSDSSRNSSLNTKDVKMEHDKNDENSETKSSENDTASVSAKPPGNSYWVEALDLKYREKCIIEVGHWVCDKVINAALTLLRSVYTTVNGLSDVTSATRCGFPPSTADEHFVQIIGSLSQMFNRTYMIRISTIVL